jgi:hypothetical protein
MPFIQHLMELANSIISYLNTPEMLPVIAGAVIGAIFAGIVTLIISLFSSFSKQSEINQRVRSVIKASLDSNKLMCISNLGILNNEMEGMKDRGRFTLTPLFRFHNSGADLIFSNAKFSRFEVELLWSNLTGIDAIQNQLKAMIEVRQNLQVKIRGESVKSMEWELSGMLVEYDQFLIERYEQSILNIHNALHILNMSLFEKFVLKFTYKNINQ